MSTFQLYSRWTKLQTELHLLKSVTKKLSLFYEYVFQKSQINMQILKETIPIVAKAPLS